MRQLPIVLWNTLTLLVTLGVNAWAGSSGINGRTVGSVSDANPSPITPADYAFGIWIVIYLGLMAFVAFQWVEYLRKWEWRSDTGWWFGAINILNVLWLLVWLNGQLLLSVVIMLGLLLSLLLLSWRLRLQVWDAPLRVIVFVWWPLALCLGWIILAAATNLAAYLSSTGLMATWLSLLLLVLAVAAYVALTFGRNMRETCLVGAWGLIAIAVRESSSDAVQIAAIAGAVIVLAAAAIHAWQNREFWPTKKWRRGEV